MKTAVKNSAAKFAAAALVLFLLSGCSPAGGASPTPSASPAETPSASPTETPAEATVPPIAETPGPTVYQNDQYGFTFTLPESWEGYTIVETQWEAISVNGEKDPITGPKLLIRHPDWTEDAKREDIPIMIIPLDQWDLLMNATYHIGAAPLEPTELGRNNAYVFALPARYNFDFLEGYEEVDEILQGNPLKGVDIAQ
jgi:hypothetical protein